MISTDCIIYCDALSLLVNKTNIKESIKGQLLQSDYELDNILHELEDKDENLARSFMDCDLDKLMEYIFFDESEITFDYEESAACEDLKCVAFRIPIRFDEEAFEKKESIMITKVNKIDSFRGEYFFLSNFFTATVTYKGFTYQNNEAAFQAQKCVTEDERKQFVSLTGAEAKKAGRRVQLRKDWEAVKVGEMREIVKAKFFQNPNLAEKLLATGDMVLEEGNNWGDKTWGTVNGFGQNLLGKILMEVRDMLNTARQKEKKGKQETMTREETKKRFRAFCQMYIGNNCSGEDEAMFSNIMALLERGVVFPLDSTNGTIIKTVFPDAEILEDEEFTTVTFSEIEQNTFDNDWWNASFTGVNI